MYIQKIKRGENFKICIKTYPELIITRKASFIRWFMVFIVKNLHQHRIVTHAKLLKISKDTDYEFQISFQRTSLYYLVQKLGFKCKKCDKCRVIIESMKIVVWSCKYLLEIAKYRTQKYLIVYVNETWYYSHDTAKKIWTDSSKEFNLCPPVSKELWFVMLATQKVF